MRVHRWCRILALLCIALPRVWACLCLSTPACSLSKETRAGSAVFVGVVLEVSPAPGPVRGIFSADRLRVRFQVDEIVAGPRVTVVYTDSTSCGYPFQLGVRYLVNALASRAGHFTGACLRNSRMDTPPFWVQEDLKAWRAKTPLAPRIYGAFQAGEFRADTQLRLLGAGDDRPVPIGPNGRFAIENLKPVSYVLRVSDARGSDERTLDLSSVPCYEATPYFHGAWSIGVAPVVLRSRPEVRRMDEPRYPNRP